MQIAVKNYYSKSPNRALNPPKPPSPPILPTLPPFPQVSITIENEKSENRRRPSIYDNYDEPKSNTAENQRHYHTISRVTSNSQSTQAKKDVIHKLLHHNNDIS